jgi:NAD kinase
MFQFDDASPAPDTPVTGQAHGGREVLEDEIVQLLRRLRNKIDELDSAAFSTGTIPPASRTEAPFRLRRMPSLELQLPPPTPEPPHEAGCAGRATQPADAVVPATDELGADLFNSIAGNRVAVAELNKTLAVEATAWQHEVTRLEASLAERDAQLMGGAAPTKRRGLGGHSGERGERSGAAAAAMSPGAPILGSAGGASPSGGDPAWLLGNPPSPTMIKQRSTTKLSELNAVRASSPHWRATFRLNKVKRYTDTVVEPDHTMRTSVQLALQHQSLMKLVWEQPPRTALIVAKPDPTGLTDHILEQLGPWLDRHGVRVLQDRAWDTGRSTTTAGTGWTRSWRGPLASVDFVICLGGDGSLLRAAELYRGEACPPVMAFAVIGGSRRSRAFLTPFALHECHAALSGLLGGQLTVMLRHRLSCLFERGTWYGDDGGEEEALSVLNEVVVDRGESSSLTLLNLYCDDQLVTQVQADGLIIATATGSTAYSLSAGGSMVHPGVAAIMVTPVCAHTLSFRPLLFPATTALRIEIPPAARADAWASLDGRYRRQLGPGVSLHIGICEHPVPVFCRLTQTADWLGALCPLQWNLPTA